MKGTTSNSKTSPRRGGSGSCAIYLPCGHGIDFSTNTASNRWLNISGGGSCVNYCSCGPKPPPLIITKLDWINRKSFFRVFRTIIEVENMHLTPFEKFLVWFFSIWVTRGFRVWGFLRKDIQLLWVWSLR